MDDSTGKGRGRFSKSLIFAIITGFSHIHISLQDFLAALALLTSFPPDIHRRAETEASLWNEGERAQLLETLQRIHVSCVELEEQQSRKFQEALDEIMELRRQAMPAITEEMHVQEEEEATQTLQKEIDNLARGSSLST